MLHIIRSVCMIPIICSLSHKLVLRNLVQLNRFDRLDSQFLFPFPPVQAPMSTYMNVFRIRSKDHRR
jgi:hypothetical protein